MSPTPAGAPFIPVAARPAYLVGLAVAPALAALGVLVAPRLAVPAWAAALVVFAGAIFTVTLPLACAAIARPSKRIAVALAAVGAACVLAAALVVVDPRASAVLVDAGLVTFAAGVGGGLGLRIQHPGHLLPACAVAAAADLASVLSPAGPTHAIAESPRALSLLAVAFAVPGTTHVAPALGAGDALFFALVLGCGAAHGLSIVRLAVVGALAFAAAGAMAAATGATIPALVVLGAFVVASTPRARALRPEDRRVAGLGLAVAGGVAVAVIAQRLIGR